MYICDTYKVHFARIGSIHLRNKTAQTTITEKRRIYGLQKKTIHAYISIKGAFTLRSTPDTQIKTSLIDNINNDNRTKRG